MLALNFHHLAVVELLLKWGADVNAADQVGVFATLTVADFSMTRSVSQFCGVCQAGSTALMLAAELGDASALTCLLEAGANANACDKVAAFWDGLHDLGYGREADGLVTCVCGADNT